jgi:hypothetical protein
MNNVEFSQLAGKVRNKYINTMQENTEFAEIIENAMSKDDPYLALPEKYKIMFDSVV